MTNHHYTPVDELRTATRFVKERGTEVAVLCRPGFEEFLVDVHDESLGGLGVYVSQDHGLVVGEQLDIVYAGEYLRAFVRHIEPHQDGESIVGFSCQRELLAAAP